MRALRTILVAAALASPALAQTGSTTPWTRLVINSKKLGETRTILVATPANYATTGDRYPVLVLLDADDAPQFTAAVANVAFLTSRNAIPPLLVVGIANGKDRTHDMTPAATGPTAKNFPSAGGASGLADFILDEALPKVRSTYRTLPSTILAAHSFGGLFALDVAAKRPEAFAGIVAMSPSLWWNDSTAAVAYADAIAKSSKTPRLFATSGGLEPPIAITTRRFAAHLDSIKPMTLAFASQHYPDDTHGLTPAPSLMDGLRFVFEPVSIAKTPLSSLGPTSDSAAVVNALVTTEESYGRGARSLGLPDQLPEGVVNNLGYNVLQGLKLPRLAVWVFQRNVDTYPNSANVYDSLGDGMLAAGDSSGARTQFRRARDVAVRNHQPVSAETQKKLASLEHVLQAGKPR